MHTAIDKMEEGHKLADLLIYHMCEDSDDREMRLRDELRALFMKTWEKWFGPMSVYIEVNCVLDEGLSMIAGIKVHIHSVADNFRKLEDGTWAHLSPQYRHPQNEMRYRGESGAVPSEGYVRIDPRGLEPCPGAPIDDEVFQKMALDFIEQSGADVEIVGYRRLVPAA